MNGHIATATIAEAGEPPNREHVIERLRDWRDRVHALYDLVEATLGNTYSYDRTGKHRSNEELVQRVGLSVRDVPQVDILRVEQSGKLVASFQPRGLWIIGANGRIDLLVAPRSGGRRVFMLVDHSLPMSDRTDWRIVRLSEQLKQMPFRPENLHELLE